MRPGAKWFVVMLAGYAAALGYEAWHLGATVDEPSHLMRAYSWWERRQIMFPPDTPPLTWMTSGWIPLLIKPPVLKDTDAWRIQSSFVVGHETLRESGALAARRLVFFTRLTYLVFPLLAAWLLWHWARQLFSESTSLILTACAMLEPTLLGHGPLLKTDVASAFAALLFFYQAWRYWQRPDLRRALGLVFCLLLAMLVKFTLAPLVVVALALLLWRGPRLAGTLALFAILYGGILAAYQFRDIRPVSRQDLEQFRDDGFTPRELSAIRLLGRLPWPPQFIDGLRFVERANRNQGFPAYMLGRKIEYGAPGYFPLAWAIKFPIALQLATAAGLAALLARLRRGETSAIDAFVWFPPALFLGLAMRSHIHMGFRHLLPVLPFLILGAGFALDRWSRRGWARAAAGGCLLWLAVASARIYPQGISYFNEWVGGPQNGWKYLADSNIDWGQNLPELGAWVAGAGVDKIQVGFFGFDIIEHYLPAEKFESMGAPWDRQYVTTTRLEPAPGVYAISVTMMLGYFFEPEYHDYFAWFRERNPDAKAGYSIFIYYVR